MFSLASGIIAVTFATAWMIYVVFLAEPINNFLQEVFDEKTNCECSKTNYEQNK